MIIEHEFTSTIRAILEKQFPQFGDLIFAQSELLQYLNIKTASASRGSKARSAFANNYAIDVLVEDYVKKGYHQSGDYSLYEGAPFSALFTRQRELPFGSRLQNHALNHRLNREFQRYFPTCEYTPILRDTSAGRYWINEHLLIITIKDQEFNIAQGVLEIIDAYIEAKTHAFNQFIQDCQAMQAIQQRDPQSVQTFIAGLLRPNVDARIFEIVSYAILKAFYSDQVIYWGWDHANIQEEALTLYKTGRTNANDGGIDFVMKPLGRFFQVTETVDFRKYFLDIDKIQKYPLTFVIKSDETIEYLRAKIEEQAQHSYGIQTIINRYMDSIEEIINISELLLRLNRVIEQGKLNSVIQEIISQSKVEFNYA